MNNEPRKLDLTSKKTVIKPIKPLVSTLDSQTPATAKKMGRAYHPSIFKYQMSYDFCRTPGELTLNSVKRPSFVGSDPKCLVVKLPLKKIMRLCFLEC